MSDRYRCPTHIYYEGDKPCPDCVPTVSQDDYYANSIKEICHTYDKEVDHREADQFLLKLLTELGCTKTVDAWNEVTKWYA